MSEHLLSRARLALFKLNAVQYTVKQYGSLVVLTFPACHTYSYKFTASSSQIGICYACMRSISATFLLGDDITAPLCSKTQELLAKEAISRGGRERGVFVLHEFRMVQYLHTGRHSWLFRTYHEHSLKCRQFQISFLASAPKCTLLVNAQTHLSLALPELTAQK